MPRKRTNYSPEFKQQMIRLIESGKPRKEVLSEYDLNPSTLDRWIKEYRSPSDKNNPEIELTAEQKKIAELEVQNKQLMMEVDILKQAALIIGKRSK